MHNKLALCYIGCYADNTPRDISIDFTSYIGQMTVELCVRTCLSHGFLYAGVQDGYIYISLKNLFITCIRKKAYLWKRSQCFCGNSFGTYGISSNCNSPCNRNTNETCGGPWANSVYLTNCQTTTVTSIKYLRVKN